MSEELKMRACEPFFLPRNGQGTGLGRSIVDSSGEQAGGSVQIDSALGKDTAITTPCRRPPRSDSEEGTGA